MKNILNIVLLIVLSNSLVKAQSACSKFYPFREGLTTQITTYNKKGKVAAVTDYKITSIENNGEREVATVNLIMKDKKGKLIGESSYDMTCSANYVSIDINSLMNAQLFKQFNDFEVEISGKNIDIPNKLTIGQELPDAEMKIAMNMAGIVMNMSIDISNRKVEATETITTPAGTYECYAISYQTDLHMGFSKTIYSKQWISKGVGLVKQEDYNKRGKVISSSLLTMLSDN